MAASTSDPDPFQERLPQLRTSIGSGSTMRKTGNMKKALLIFRTKGAKFEGVGLQQNMAPKSAPSGGMRQERVFYTKEWTEDIDTTFLRGLAEQTVQGNPVNLGPNKTAIRSAMHKVNRLFHTHFDYSTCLDRFRKLRKRYEVYSWIITLPGVTYDPNTYDVTCEECAWDFIFRSDPLAMAYKNKGESEFHILKYIFDERDPEILRNKDGHEIIQISSDHTGFSSKAEEDEDENIDNVFCNELAWYNSETERDNSQTSSYIGSRQSTNINVQVEWNSVRRSQPSSSRGQCSTGPSSVASSSPFKKK